MTFAQLLLATVCAFLAIALASPAPANSGHAPAPPPNGGPPPRSLNSGHAPPKPPHAGGPGGPGKPAGPGGKAPGKSSHEGGPKDHGDHECDDDECGLPDWANKVDNDTHAKLVQVWSGFNGSNCTEQKAKQEAIMKAGFLVQMDAKAANLTATQKVVYNQFKAAFIAFDALSMDDKAALQAIMPQGGNDGWEGHPKCPRGPKPPMGPKGPKNSSHD